MLAWPPEPDSRYDPLVFDTKHNVVLSVEQAAATRAPSEPVDPPVLEHDADSLPLLGDSLAAFEPQDRVWKTARQRLIASAGRAARVPSPLLLRVRPTPRVLLATFAVLATVQMAVLIYVLVAQRDGRASAPAPIAPSLPTGAVAQPVQAVAAELAVGTGSEPSAKAADAAVTADGGRLVVKGVPTGAAVFVDGRRRGTAPLTLDELPAGTHQVQIEGGGMSVAQEVVIEAGSTTSLLIPVAQTSWLDIDSPIEVRVFEGGLFLGTSASGPIKVKPGTHQLELRNDALGYDGRLEATVKGGDVSRVKPVLPDGVLQVNALPWAHVWIDGLPVGDTPLGRLRASLGPHEIRFLHPERGEQVRQVVVSALAPTRVSVDFR